MESVCQCQFQHLCQLPCTLHCPLKISSNADATRVRVVSLFNGCSASGEYNGIYIDDLSGPQLNGKLGMTGLHGVHRSLTMVALVSSV